MLERASDEESASALSDLEADVRGADAVLGMLDGRRVLQYHVLHHGVKIVGPVNLPAQLPFHASEMYARNLLNFLKPALDKAGNLALDWNDEVFAKSVLTHDGSIRYELAQKLVEGK